MRYLYACLLILSFISCNKPKNTFTAQEIIDKSILASGTHKLKNAILGFNFRDKFYRAKRTKGTFTLTRTFDSITDVLSNTGFQRLINKKPVTLSDSIANNYANAVNSVHYFAVLPLGLNDKAVIKQLLPSSTIKNKEYYKIQISFKENGGGEDHQDVFIYWIDKKDFLIDYLAYAYQTNGGGKRFRALKEAQFSNGIQFANYDNYKPLDKNTSLINLDNAFNNNQLEKVSEIVLENISVSFLN